MPPRWVDYFQFPLALVLENGFVVQANPRWLDIMNVFEGEPLYKHMNLKSSIESEEFWKKEKTQVPEFGEKLSLLHKQEGRCQLYLSRVNFEQSVFFLARLEIVATSHEDTNKVAHAKRLQEMAEMAAGISHEITNPLTVIAANTAILECMMKERTPEGISEILRIIQIITQQCHRITKIVRAMRTFSREGTFDPMVPVPIHQLVEEALALCVEKSRHKGTQFHIEQNDSKYSVQCRPIHIVQILVNLFNNAIDATAEVPLPTVTVAFKRCGDLLEIRTSDNGAGVPEEIAEKIFTPFYTTKEVGKGTGLGLNLSLRLSQMNGGSLSLDRKQGASCFVLKLPLSTLQKVAS